MYYSIVGLRGLLRALPWGPLLQAALAAGFGAISCVRYLYSLYLCLFNRLLHLLYVIL